MSGSRNPNSSSSSTASKQQLSSWGLPQPILEAFSKKGLKQLYPWQAAALECAAAGNNLVYCAPTSGGKSLVADVLMLARLHKTQQALLAKLGPSSRRKPQQKPVTRALIVLPYLSIVSEKTAHLSKLLECVKWRVMGYQGDDADGQPLVHQAERVSICSIEKANGAINRMIQEQRLHELVSVTIDEAHMLADPNRGAALEMLLAKLMASRAQSAIQIVAMSTTMSGLDSLSAWLDAHLFLTNFRPVPLTEHAVFQGTVFAKAERQQLLKLEGGDGAESDCILQEQRVLEGGPKTDKDSFLTLVAEVVAERHSVLVFCAGRAACQSCAAMLADQLLKRLGPPDPAAAAARADLIEQLRIALSGSSDAAFEKLLAAGVAFHHAGLTHQERSVVEQGFSSGALLVLTATSTLAAGVNLPARRVILRSLWQGVGDVTRAQYLQMVGRAGRAGHSAVGESYLVAQGAPHSTSGQWTKVCQLLAAPLPVLHSQLVQQLPPTGQAITKPGPKQQQTQQQQQQQQLSALPPNGHAAASGGCSSCPPGATATGASGHRSELTQGASSGGASGYIVTSQTGPAGSHDPPNGSLYTTGSDTAAVQAVAAAVASRAPASQPHLQQHVSSQQQGRGTGTSLVSTAAQPNMQHLLLDAVATGMVSTGQTILQLLQNTLAYFHLPFDVLADAAKAALSALRARKLISFKPDGPDGPSHWELTALGSAVVASALAPDVGLLLHRRLANMLACMVLGSNVHLLYVLQPDPLLTIYDWSCWHRLMNELSPPQQRVAEVEGLEQLYIDRRMAGLRGDAISDAQHGRFAAAVLLDRLVADISSMHALEQAWGKPSTLTKGGISRGTMQRWQMEVSKTAAMAALLAANAGWWQLETLLAPLAAQVAAGVRPELLALMKVPGMQPSHASALHAAGFGHPDLLLCASESEVAAALAAGLPANMCKRKALDRKGLSVGLTGNASTNAMVARAARSVLAAARQYAVMAAAAAEAAGDEDKEQQASLQSQQQQVPSLITLRTKMLVGQATIHQVWPTSNDPLLPCLLDTWQLQSSFSLAVLLSEQRCAATVAASAGNPAGGAAAGGGWLCSSSTEHRQQRAAGAGAGPSSGAGCAALHGGVAAALVLCWADREAVLLHLPGSRSSPEGSSNRGGGSGGCSRPGGGCSTLGRGAATACTTQPHQATAAEAAGGAGSTAAAAVQGGVNTDVAGWVWSVIDHIFGDSNKTVTCIGASQVLAALAAAGIHCNTAVDDPCSAFMLWQPRGLDSAAAAAAAAATTNQQQEQQQQKPPVAASVEEASKAAAAVVLGGAFRLQVPLLPGSNAAAATAATAAAKAALLGRALMPPLRAMLAKQQLTAAYERVEQPLQQVIAEVRGTGLRVQCRHIQQQLQLCVWQLQMLQQQISQYVGQQQQQQQQQLDDDSAQGCGVDDSSIRLLLRQQRLLTVSNDRLQQQPLLQLVLLALKAAFKRKHTAALPLLRLLLTYCHVQQYEQQLQQLLQYSVLPGYQRQPVRGPPLSFAGDSYNNSYNGVEPSAMPHQGYIILQPMASAEPVTGQLLPGWPAGLEGLMGFRPVPALPVLTSNASLAQQGVASLSSPVSVAAALQPSSQQQQQQYVVGRLCAVASSSGSAGASLCTSQQLPWQMQEDSTALPSSLGTAAAAGGAAGGVRGQQQQHCSADWAACSRLGSIRVWCGVTESVRELQLPTTALYRVHSHHNHQQQQQQSSWYALQQQQQQQQHCDASAVSWGAATHPVTAQRHSSNPTGLGSIGGSNGSDGSLAFLPSCCSLTRLLQPTSPTHTFIGVELQCLPLLVLAGLSQDKTLISACCQNPDPLAAAAAAWCPSSGLPESLQAALLGNIQAGVLDGVPVAAADAPRLLFAAALQGLVCGHKPSVQREQLGVEWPAGTNLVESLLKAFPGVAAWRRQLLEDVQNTRFLKTCSGRKIPFKIPPAGQNPSKALVKHIKEAERSSVSLMLLSCMGDVERLVAAAVYRACGNLQGSLRSSSAGGGTADGRGSGALEPGSLAAPGDDDRPDRHQAARVSAAAGRTQILAGAAAGPLHAGAGQGIRNGSAAGSGPAVSTAAGAACGAGPAAMAAGGGGPRAPGVTTCDAPGRLLPADAAGAPSGFGLRGAEEGSAEQQRVRCVAVGGQQVLVEVPSEWALPLLQSCSRKVSQEVSDLLGLAAEGPEPPVYPAATAAGGCGGGSLGAVAAAPEAMQLPFRWWWGSSLDLLQANFFGV